LFGAGREPHRPQPLIMRRRKTVQREALGLGHQAGGKPTCPPAHNYQGGLMTKTIKEIVIDWLEGHGYDGLCDPGNECGCPVFALMPCDEPDFERCVAAHKVLMNDGDWLMFPGKAPEFE